MMFVHDQEDPAGANSHENNAEISHIGSFHTLDLAGAPFHLQGLRTEFVWTSNRRKAVQLLEVPGCSGSEAAPATPAALAQDPPKGAPPSAWPLLLGPAAAARVWPLLAGLLSPDPYEDYLANVEAWQQGAPQATLKPFVAFLETWIEGRAAEVGSVVEAGTGLWSTGWQPNVRWPFMDYVGVDAPQLTEVNNELAQTLRQEHLTSLRSFVFRAMDLLLEPLPHADLLLVKGPLATLSAEELTAFLKLSVLACPRRFRYVMFVQDAVKPGHLLALAGGTFGPDGLTQVFDGGGVSVQLWEAQGFACPAVAPPPAECAGCLRECGPRPSVVDAHKIHLRVAELQEMRELFAPHLNAGMLSPDSERPRRPGECAKQVPKQVHAIWLGTPLRLSHAVSLVDTAMKNPQWKVHIWVDQPVPTAILAILVGLGNSSRPAGRPVVVESVLEQMHLFRNADLIRRDGNMAGKADYMRLEIIFLRGGIYLDTDQHAVHGFDDFGPLFRWPFVAHDPRTYHNLGNCVFGFERQSAFLDWALNATRENCLVYGHCGVMSGAGPGFLTGAYLRWGDPDILLIDQWYLVHPVGDHTIMWQAMEANWLKPAGSA